MPSLSSGAAEEYHSTVQENAVGAQDSTAMVHGMVVKPVAHGSVPSQRLDGDFAWYLLQKI